MAKSNNLGETQIGRRFKAFRNHLDLTQSELASSLGINQSTVAGIEKGKFQPSLSIIINLMEIHHLSSDWLLTGRGGMVAETIEELTGNVDYSGFKEEIKDLLCHMERVPMVRDFILESFVVFKLRHKKKIRECLEKESDSRKSFSS